MRDSRYDVLFEPVRLGPVTARNRFFQVPHCNGMGWREPRAHAAMRGIKAEGGWAVVCTEEVEIHPSTDVTPYVEGRLWDDSDIAGHALLTEAVHAHGSLAGIELVHSGLSAANLSSRLAPLGPGHLPVKGTSPVQARRATLAELAELRRWHRAAVARSLRAGYDVVYVYAGHSLSIAQHFLSPRTNTRDDAYGGDLRGRARLLRELLEDTLAEVDGRAAVACRLVVDERLGERGIQRAETDELLGLVGELPDLWDFMVGAWEEDSETSRFGGEAFQEPYVRGLSTLTSKPVVGVGRLTSPDTMVRLIRDGVLDLIGAARPSIADPFLPRKIEEGRLDDLRECIGCNVCVAGDLTMAPIRCTQNPSMGEEWRRGWHPERMRPKGSDASVLVVGAGPAGLEAAVSLGRRGYSVVVAEATRDVGGRVAREARLPGLAAWIRVVDHRREQLRRLGAVEQAFGSEVTADEVLEHGFAHVAVATGARWRDDGVGRVHTAPAPLDGVPCLTPDDLMAGARPEGGRVVLFDDDHYYLGGVLAELLAGEGREVTLVTTAAVASAWTVNTLEQHRIQRRLLEAGVRILASHALTGAGAGVAQLACTYTGRPRELPCDALVLVTARLPRDGLVTELEARSAAWAAAGLQSVRAVGDAYCPGTIAAAVWDGRRYAEELDGPPADDVGFKRELVGAATY